MGPCFALTRGLLHSFLVVRCRRKIPSTLARDRVRQRHSELTPQAVLEMEWESVKLSLSNLRTFPWIAERERDGRLKLHGGHFSVAEGKFYLLDEAEVNFRPVS